MAKNNFSNTYDDGNIPQTDLPQNKNSKNTSNSMSNSTNSNSGSNRKNGNAKQNYNANPLPESSRPRKDGPGGA